MRSCVVRFAMTKDLEISGVEVSGNKREEEVQSINQLIADAERFQNDPDKYSQLHTEDAIIVNVAGRRIIGRDAFYQVMKEAVKTTLVDVPTKTDIKNITFIRSDVAIVSCLKLIADNRDIREKDKFEEGSKANQTFVATKEHGNWSIAMAQSTLIQN